MKTDTIEIRVLTADDGKLLTNGETYSTQVYLGSNDDPENWQEVNDEGQLNQNDEGEE